MENVINLRLAMEDELSLSGQWTLDTSFDQLGELIRKRIGQGGFQIECINQELSVTEEKVPLDKETLSRLKNVSGVS